MNLNMDSVESLVAQIQGLSGNLSDINHLHNLLKQSEELLHSESTSVVSSLAELDPSIHSLGYLYFLKAILSGPVSKEEANGILVSVARFINSCVVEQIHLAPEKFIFICRWFKDQVILLEAPIRGVAPMLTAVRKLQVSSEQLTALHPDFLLLCVLAKCYKTGVSILEDDIFEVDQPRDFFLYCYYGGMICVGQKQFGKALELLHNVVTAPMSTLSAIAVESYKKYILVSLIRLGQFSVSFPKYTSSVAQRNLKTTSQPYLELANSYGTGKISELETFVQTNMEKFESDNNLGLVKQVVSSMYKRNIQRLTQTYLTLSLQDIANTVQLSSSKEAEMHVLQMIEDGEIYATINQKDGMVRFLEDPEQYKTCAMIEHIDSSMKRIMLLSKKLTSLDELMSCDPMYLAKVGRERQRYDFDDLDSVPQRFNI
ncbi:COP9 signalosome complex subunit 3 isoform X1 [Nicotiana tabacum]|uniref:COP9 signalosome complex subunit 3 n=2 Tax=Nicotiana TaxID=4085 RepID=A0A1S4C6K9_TOBAC|nr:PREDICTED: COP9 signalosome complex subunit 3 [Nicotiana sylvestris]XP_016496867.1 PREDICTED: COP9 signalosome complex subunit 3-like isoform X1 [Nicotiana tabacum]